MNVIGAPASASLLPWSHAALTGQGRHLLEDGSIFLHLIKLLLLVLQGLAPIGEVHVPQGQGRLLGLLALPLLGLHPLQPCQPARKVLQLCVPLPHLPAMSIAPALGPWSSHGQEAQATTSLLSLSAMQVYMRRQVHVIRQAM